MKLRRHNARSSRISLTPLIDVVFLLLVFFMLASTFLRLQFLPIDTGGPGAAPSDLRESVLVRVGASGVIDINGEPVGLADLAARLDEWAGQGAERAVVRVMGEARTEDLVRVLEQARQSRIDKLAVVR